MSGSTDIPQERSWTQLHEKTVVPTSFDFHHKPNNQQ